MPILTYGVGGVEGLTFRPPHAPGFRPAEGTAGTLDTSFLWEMLPDDLQDLPSRDRETFEASWAAMIQAAAGHLAEIAHLDQAATLTDFPVYAPRKWINVPVFESAELRTGVGALESTLSGAPGARLLEGTVRAVETVIEMAQSAECTGVGVRLRAPQSSSAGAVATVSMALRDVYPAGADTSRGLPGPYSGAQEAWAVFGYGDLDARRLAPGSYAAVSTRGRLAAVAVHPGGTATWELASAKLDAAEVAYGVTVSVQVEAEGEGWRRVRAGVTGERTGIGVSVSLTARSEYRATHVVVVGADTRIPVDPPYDGLFQGGPRRPFAVVPRTMRWVDVTLPATVRALPSLQARVARPDEVLIAGVDYLLAGDEDAAEIRFVDAPAVFQWMQDEQVTQLWAENLGMNLQLMQSVFGPLIGVPQVTQGEDSLELQNKLVALLYGLVSGPHPHALSVAVGALAGVPIALESGTVWSINQTALDPEIVVRGVSGDRRYRYPEGLTPLVRVGDSVQALQQLVQSPVLYDWLDPEFIGGVRLNRPSARIRSEAEKYSATYVEIPYSEGMLPPAELGEHIRAYLRRATALWVGALRVFLSWVFPVSDQLRMLDALNLDVTLHLLTALTNARDPRYNDPRGFVYDGSLVYNEAEFDILRDRLYSEATNTSGAPLTIHVFGADVTIPAGGTVITPEPL